MKFLNAEIQFSKKVIPQKTNTHKNVIYSVTVYINQTSFSQ